MVKSKNKPLLTRSILHQGAAFLEHSNRRGALHHHRDPNNAIGLVCGCPGVKEGQKAHSLLLLFNHDLNDEVDNPAGRWTHMRNLPLESLTLLEEVFCRDTTCNWRGYISGGQLVWRG